MGKRRNVTLISGPIDLDSFEQAIEEHEKRHNENMNQTLRKAVRKGETGPGAKARKIGRIDWKQ